MKLVHFVLAQKSTLVSGGRGYVLANDPPRIVDATGVRAMGIAATNVGDDPIRPEKRVELEIRGLRVTDHDTIRFELIAYGTV